MQCKKARPLCPQWRPRKRIPANGSQLQMSAKGTNRFELKFREPCERGLAGQPGSMPFALITATAAGAARNLTNARAASASLLVAETAAEK